MRLNLTLFTCIFYFSTQLFSQDTAVTRTWSGSKLHITGTPGLGTNSDVAMEFPLSAPKPALKRLDFWVTGFSAFGDTLAVCSDIFSNKKSWYPGPFASSGSQRHVQPGQWTSICPLTAEDVNIHRSSYQQIGYVPKAEIAKWPSNFGLSGFPRVIAPYADVNLNNSYEPLKGDFPFVPGNEHVFVVGSDSSSQLFAAGESAHLDASVLWFTALKPDSVPQTVFFRITTCNRGASDMMKIKVSAVADMAIGTLTDNFLATNVKHSAVIGYNGPGGDAVYGADWPAVAVGWLSEKASNSMYFEQGKDAVKGQPTFKSDFYNLANSQWKTGKFLSFGGSGLDGLTPSQFIYSNGTDPAQSFKDWDEIGGTEGRRTGLISYFLDTLRAGKCRAADGHITIISEAPDSAECSLALKKVDDFYYHSNFNVGVNNPILDKRISIYPNPVKPGEYVYSKAFIGNFKCTLCDFSGRKISILTAENGAIKIDVLPGLYYLYTPDGKAAILQVQ